jgi:hypothetical protein
LCWIRYQTTAASRRQVSTFATNSLTTTAGGGQKLSIAISPHCLVVETCHSDDDVCMHTSLRSAEVAPVCALQLKATKPQILDAKIFRSKVEKRETEVK